MKKLKKLNLSSIKILTLLLILINSQFASASWEQTKGPEGGNIKAIVSAYDGYAFCATDRGLYRSKTAGTSWAFLQTDFSTSEISCLAVTKSQNILVGTIGKGIYRSTDYGETWTAVNTGLSNKNIYSLAASPQGKIYAGVYEEFAASDIYISDNGGLSWTPTNFNDGGLPGSIVVSLEGDVFAIKTDYFGEDCTLFRSTDQGNNWTSYNLQQSDCTQSFTCLDISENGDVYVGTTKGNIIKFLSDMSLYYTKYLPTSDRIKAISIGITEIYAGTSSRLYFSDDYGNNWNEVGRYNVNCFDYMTFAGTMGDGVIGSGGSLDGSMFGSNTGIINTSIISMAVNKDGYVFASTESSGLFKSSDNGANWDNIYSESLPVKTGCLASNAKGGIYLGNYYGLYSSDDNGETWNDISLGLSDVSVKKIAVNSSGDIFVATWDGISRSKDNGITWTEKNNGITDINVNALAINSIGVIFAGTNGGLFRSTNNGDTWVNVFEDIGFRVNSLAINSDNVIITGTNSGEVYKSNNSGDTWSLFIGVPKNNYSIKDLFAFGKSFYAGTDRGIYSYSDGKFELDNQEITSFTSSGGKFFAGTKGNGIYLNNPVVNGVDELSDENTFFAYPNPSSGILNIEFSPINSNTIALQIHNLLGEIMYEDEYFEKDRSFSKILDISKLSSGIYILSLQSGDKTMHQKIVLEK